MARRRFNFARRARRSASRFTRKATRRSNSSGGSPFAVVVPALAYGAGRQYLVNLIRPVTAMLPFGQYADEAGLGILNYYVAKKNMFGLGKVARVGLAIEAASVGSQLIGSIGGTTQAASTYVYS